MTASAGITGSGGVSSGGADAVGGAEPSSGGQTSGGAGQMGGSGGAPGGNGGQAGAAGACDHPLDDATLSRLVLLPIMTRVIELEPGDTYEFSYRRVESNFDSTPIATCTEWSMTPTAGASLDPASGRLTIDPGTPGGTVYTVTGNLENGRHVDSVDVYVVTQSSHPIIGIWREVARYDCVTGAEVPANPNPIGEIRFDADGRLAVTWVPFETYYDYWANYTLDLDAGTMEATIDHGNYVPQDTDLFGSFHIDAAKDLVLRDVWFGTAKVSTATAACGHRLTGGYRWH